MSNGKAFRLGLIVESKWDADKSVHYARHAEEMGYDDVWVNDYIFDHDPFSVLARISAETKRVRLGTGVVNPYVRHPAIIAASIGTVAASATGRTILGIGSSVNIMLKPITVSVERPVQTCKEAIEVIRLLLKGSSATYEGSRFRLQDAKLSFKVDDEIPIFLGIGTGRNMMQMCGEMTDGAFLMEATREFFGDTIQTIGEGIKHSNRRRNRRFEALVNQLMCVERNRRDAIEQLRPVMAENLARKGIEGAKIMGLDEDKWKAYSSDYKSIPDDFIQEFALCGTVDDCLEHINNLRKVGITQIAHRFPTLEQMNNVGELLIPAMKEQFGD